MGTTRNAKWALQDRAYSTPSKLSLTSRSEYSKLETVEGEQEALADGKEWPHFAKIKAIPEGELTPKRPDQVSWLCKTGTETTIDAQSLLRNDKDDDHGIRVSTGGDGRAQEGRRELVTAGAGVQWVDGINHKKNGKGPLSSVCNATPPEAHSRHDHTLSINHVHKSASQVGGICPVVISLKSLARGPLGIMVVG